MSCPFRLTARERQALTAVAELRNQPAARRAPYVRMLRRPTAKVIGAYLICAPERRHQMDLPVQLERIATTILNNAERHHIERAPRRRATHRTEF